MSNHTIDPRYPIGKFQPQPFSAAKKDEWLNDIKFLPGLLEMTIQNLDEKQLDTPYREGGWTVRQLIHHVADSHINAYCRFKLGLTEDNPTIRPYDEKQWALLNDVNEIPVNVSLTLLHALHRRLHGMLNALDDSQWERTIYHPASKTTMSLYDLLGMYSWHGRHHTEHIIKLKEIKGWQ